MMCVCRQERFRTLTTSYYRDAHGPVFCRAVICWVVREAHTQPFFSGGSGMIVVYDVTDAASFQGLDEVKLAWALVVD